MQDVTGKFAFITGGASGMGLAKAQAAQAAEGAFGKVHVVCNNAGVAAPITISEGETVWID